VPHVEDEPHSWIASLIVTEFHIDALNTIHKRRIGDDLLGGCLLELTLIFAHVHG
jgi:hypothetical protein